MPSASLTWLLEVPLPTLPDPPPEIPSQNNYTDEEVSDAVGKLVAGSIRRPYGALGERKTLDAFDDTMDAAAGVFILTPESPFYVILLGARRLNDDISSAITSAVELLESIQSMGRRSSPLTSLSTLGNARAALLALENASAQRQSSFDSIGDNSAFQRFDTHTNRFLADAASSIKVGENIVQTPQQARKSLGTLVAAVVEAFQSIQSKARLLEAGIDNYNSLNLPALLAQGVISKARGVLDDRISQLETLTPTDRLEFLRDTALDVLAGKAVVRGFGSLTKSGTFIPIEGNGQAFTDENHLGNQATVSSTRLDPYVIIDGADSLTFDVDGHQANLTIPIQQSFLARLEGSIPEPWDIVLDTNDTLLIGVSPGTAVSVTLTAGTRTAAQVAADINAAVTTQPVLADTFLAPEKFIGVVDAIGSTGSAVTFQLPSGLWSDLNVNVGDAVIVRSGTMAQIYLTIAFRIGPNIICTVSGPGTTVNESDVTISVGPQGRYLRVRVNDGDEESSLLSNLTISADDVTDSAWTTFGFFTGVSSRCRRTRADEVALSVNATASSSVSGVARIAASAVFVGGGATPGRTDPNDPTRVISSIFRATGDVTTPGATATFALPGASGAGVVVGDTVTVRSSPDPDEVGLHGLVTAVSDVAATATMSGALAVGEDLELEFGRTLGLLVDAVVRVSAPSPVSGDYRVLVDSENPMEATLDRPFPLFYGNGAQPLTFSMETGAFRVDFQSLSQTLDSELRITGTAAPKFFINVPAGAVGSTHFVLLEKDPKVLSVGDILELYTGDYSSPEFSLNIVGFELGQKLIELDGAVPEGFEQLEFVAQIDTPFARIRKLQRNNYDDFRVQLGLWLGLDVNAERFFSDLNRLINPLIVNQNPTNSAVNSAKLHVQSLIQAMQQLQVVISGYEVDVVPQVDTLIDSFLSRGADRAVDTLLEARFVDFFGYNSEEVSYLGNALERLRDVSRLDLPVRKTQRKEVIDQEMLLSESEDPDFEFDQSDIQDDDEPDIPGQFVELPGSNF